MRAEAEEEEISDQDVAELTETKAEAKKPETKVEAKKSETKKSETKKANAIQLPRPRMTGRPPTKQKLDSSFYAQISSSESDG